MPTLTDYSWRVKYTPDDGDLVHSFYVPALHCADRYDRLTGYFSATALALAARGVEGLVRNRGRMRLIVGLTLEQPEITAIEKGEALKATVDRRILASPLLTSDPETVDALELLSWMISEGYLDIKISVPCDGNRKPIPAQGIFHEKAGIIEDKTGDKIAFNGSLNETAAGWTRNWESLNVFTSWDDAKRVAHEENNFLKIWSDKANHVITLDIPSAAKADLLRFLPKDEIPSRMKAAEQTPPPIQEPPAPPQMLPPPDLLRQVWNFIRMAPSLQNRGERVGEATCSVVPWQHQVRAFQRMYGGYPTKLLIADEVGLGKTIQAGLLIRQAWLSGRARRILIMAPKNVCKQWQIELREKFNLNVPLYDGQRLNWCPSPAMRDRLVKPVGRDTWHQEPIVIVSSHLMRRRERQPELLVHAEPWGLVVLDEAHHARRKGAGTSNEGGANTLLRLMRGLKERTQALLLLTATPIQVAPVEIWDLLDLLGLPPAWSADSFVRFFDELETGNPSHETLDWLSSMFRSCETTYGAMNVEEAMRHAKSLSRFKVKKILEALRDPASIPRRKFNGEERSFALKLLKMNSPVARLVSRHTRHLLRAYQRAGKLTSKIAERFVSDRFVSLTPEEDAIYKRVEDFIRLTYDQASVDKKNAVGFVLTIYRRRLASSFYALSKTLEAHLKAIEGKGKTGALLTDDDLPDEDTETDAPDLIDADDLEQQALVIEEAGDIRRLLEDVRNLPPDTKLQQLILVLSELRANGYEQAMVFTQYTDTMDFLREHLSKNTQYRFMCFSGRGGEILEKTGAWRSISRDDVKRRFREGFADILLCTDAAAEGLNFQFCGALVNYDMPWNPMRVEQRIGRIDRLGQRYDTVQIVNLHYEGTVETDVYVALKERISIFNSVVGRLQPILSKLPTLISASVLRGRADEDSRRTLADQIGTEAERRQTTGFDLDEVASSDLEEPFRPASLLNMEDLDAVLNRPDLMPPGVTVRRLDHRQYGMLVPGMNEIRLTTDPALAEEHSENMELWSPGNPMFVPPETVSSEVDVTTVMPIKDLLKSSVC